MKSADFDNLVEDIFKKCKALLAVKEAEYSEGFDRLDQFKKGTVYLGVPSHQVLAGMMLKHTTSIYDMIKEKDTNHFTIEKWEEKINDNINYLLLLSGIIEENYKNKIEGK